jgi:hypothetical protein
MTMEESEVATEVVDGVQIINYSQVATAEILPTLRNNPVIAALTEWSATTRNRAGGLFERDRFVTPPQVFEQMKLAAWAVERDDIVAGVLESTESLAFSKASFFAEEEDEEDVYNQIAGDVDLDSRLREMWRELFTVSQFTAAVWWHTKTFKVRGRDPETGVRRKKQYTLRVPRAITLLDPLKVVPVGNTLFNQEQLAYVADRAESSSIDRTLTKQARDPIIERLFMGHYEPDRDELRELMEYGIERGDTLFLLNPATVFRHTATRPQYQRFASVRMTSIFELLDLKQQLRQMDRAHLIGGTNFIVVVTKGTDQLPARPEEVANLQAQVRSVGRVPILVGDHRLNVSIVTPALDHTLQPARYAVLDARITARLYQMFVTGAGGAGAVAADDSVKLVKVIARGLESRRHMLLRSLEANIFDKIYDQNDDLISEPKLRFHPKSIALDFDADFAAFLLDLRSANDLSRETILSQFDLDQSDEARMVQRERETTDLVFQTATPFNSPQNKPVLPGQPGQPQQPGKPAQPPAPGQPPPTSRSAQRRVGRRGGGAAPGTGQGKSKPNPRKSATAEREEVTDAGSDPGELEET